MLFLGAKGTTCGFPLYGLNTKHELFFEPLELLNGNKDNDDRKEFSENVRGIQRILIDVIVVFYIFE